MKHPLNRLLHFAPLAILALSSCAHREVTPTASEPEPTPMSTPVKKDFEYGGRCAASVKANHFDVQGDPKFTLEHSGKTYCFSSAKARDDYARNVEKNIKASERNWARHADTLR